MDKETIILREKKRVKKAKKKDTIKRPTSAYIYFVSDYRIELKQKGENISKVQEVAKLCGEKWKSMSETEKEPYIEKARADKERYISQREAPDGNKAFIKGPQKPKRPATAYFLFLADFRYYMKDKNLPDGKKIPTLAGEKWRAMSDDEKKPYVDHVEEEKKQYEQDMDEYRRECTKAGIPIKEHDDDDDEEEEDDEEDDDEEDED